MPTALLRSRQFLYACLFVCGGATRAHAGDTAALRLTGLPAGARVYVDGKAAQTAGGMLTVTPGHHAVQIEAADSKGEVAACRFEVDCAAKGASAQHVRLFPVRLAPWYPYRREGEAPFEFLPAPPGERGPEGEPGAPGRAYKGWKNAPTDAEVVQSLKEALLLHLDELAAQEDDAAQLLPQPAFRFHAYIYESGDIHPEPAGPAGAPGAQGVAGLPADVFALEDTQGHALLSQAERMLGWPAVARPVQSLVDVAEPFAAANNLPPRLRLLTLAWRAQYEQKRAQGRKAALAAPPWTGTICPSGALGPHGPHGAKGADGALPPDAALVRLAPEQVRRALARLQADPMIQERMRQLQEQTRQAAQEAAQAAAATIQ